MSRRRKTMRTVVACTLATLLVGCSSSSMRIQIDVYKGPLANDVEIQKRQLSALLLTAQNALIDMDQQMEASMCMIGCDSTVFTTSQGKAGVTTSAVTQPYLMTSEDTCNAGGLIWESDKPDRSLDRICPVYLRMRKQVADIENMLCYPQVPGELCNGARNHYRAFVKWQDLTSATEQMMALNKVDIGTALCTANPAQCGGIHEARKHLESIFENVESLTDMPTVVPVGMTYQDKVESLVTEIGQLEGAVKQSKAAVQAAQSKPVFQLAGWFAKFAEHKADLSTIVSAFPAQSDFKQLQTLAGEPDELDSTDKLTALADALDQILKKLDGMALNRATSVLVKLDKDVADVTDSHAGRYALVSDVKLPGAPVSTNLSGFNDEVAAAKKRVETLRDKLRADVKARNQADALEKTYRAKLAELKKITDAIEAADEADKATLYQGKQGEIRKILEALAEALNEINNVLDENRHKNWADANGAVNGAITELNRGADVGEAKTALTNDKLRNLGEVEAISSAYGGEVTDLKLKDLNPTSAKKDLDTVVQNLNESLESAKDELRINADMIWLQGQLATTLSDLNNVLQGSEQMHKKLKSSLAHQKGIRDNIDRMSYAEVAELATAYRVLATYLSYQIASVEPPSKRLLIDVSKLANLAAEYANQFTARANALIAQQQQHRNQLSTGQYLRDTQPTAFIEIYDWLNASTGGTVDVRERIDIAKRLFDDDNWARINEVYASGYGDVSMAFIRDDIGNWNLKSFESDPSELVSAYTGLTLELIDKATKAKSPAAAAGFMTASTDALTGSAAGDAKAGQMIGSLDLQSIRSDIKKAMDETAAEGKKKTGAVKAVTLENVDSVPDEQADIKAGYELCLTAAGLGGDAPKEKKEECLKSIRDEKVASLESEYKVKLAVQAERYTLLIQALQQVTVTSAEQAAEDQ